MAPPGVPCLRLGQFMLLKPVLVAVHTVLYHARPASPALNAVNALQTASMVTAMTALLTLERVLLHRHVAPLNAGAKFWAIKCMVALFLFQRRAVVAFRENAFWAAFPGFEAYGAFTVEMAMERFLSGVLVLEIACLILPLFWHCFSVRRCRVLAAAARAHRDAAPAAPGAACDSERRALAGSPPPSPTAGGGPAALMALVPFGECCGFIGAALCPWGCPGHRGPTCDDAR